MRVEVCLRGPPRNVRSGGGHGQAALAFGTMFSIRRRDGPRRFVESAACARTRLVRGRARRLIRSLSGGAPVTTNAVHQLKADLARFSYLADEGLATAIHLAVRLRRPLLLEGEAGAGKTEVAKTLARLSGAKLLRVQCYEGIDVSQAVYEWDYARQLLHLNSSPSDSSFGDHSYKPLTTATPRRCSSSTKSTVPMTSLRHSF